MGKLTISRLALAITISGLLVYPATPALAAPKWLQEMFTVNPPKAQKQKKPQKQRRAKAKPAQSSARASGTVIRLPATAPMPGPAPRDPLAADEIHPAPPPENKPPQGASEAKLPSEVQTPSDRPTENAEPPKPESRPDAPAAPEAQVDRPVEHALPAEPPIPEFRPNEPKADEPATSEPGPEHEATEAEKATPDEPPQSPDPRSARRADPSGDLPDDEAACRWRLTKLGVKFKEGEERTDPTGCSIPYSIVVEDLGPDIDLQPQAEMNCAMAEAAARFARGPMSTAAKDVFGTSLKSIAHASGYVCRPRNGTHKLSEHAFGNALDIASFTLSNGTMIAVEPNPPEKDAEFLAKVRAAACGPFKTVLGPGSDADHAEHFHLDLAPRRNGGTVCE